MRAAPAIVAYSSLPARAAHVDALDHIFFSSSGTQSFASMAERAAFRERWLGRYLLCDAASTFVAIDEAAVIVGYVIGTIADIAHLARFADLSSARLFAGQSGRFPAHLHINVDAAWRSRGVGALLIEVFAAHAAAQGAPGMHVVTGAASRNVRFYDRCGFGEIARVTSGGGDKVFLGRGFRTAPPAAIKR